MSASNQLLQSTDEVPLVTMTPGLATGSTITNGHHVGANGASAAADHHAESTNVKHGSIRPRRLPNVMICGTGEYVTGLTGAGQSKSDKSLGVVGVTFFDLR